MNTLKGFGILASITVASIAVGICCEQKRRRQMIHALAAMPGAKNILPSLDANSRMALAALGKVIPPTSVSGEKR